MEKIGTKYWCIYLVKFKYRNIHLIVSNTTDEHYVLLPTLMYHSTLFGVCKRVAIQWLNYEFGIGWDVKDSTNKFWKSVVDFNDKQKQK